MCGNWVAEAVWDLAGKNVYRILGPAADKTELSFARLFEEFGQWCGDEAGAGRSHTKPQRLSVKMFGKNSKRKCGLWGAETNSFVAFLSSAIERHKVGLGDKWLPHHRACAALQRIIGIIRQHPRKVPVPEQQACCTAVQGYISAMRALCAPAKPKKHLLIEMACRWNNH